mmetsp:Transcript_13484/g.39132  ORF Transcript_13484/g.39132 Transcript_13484/m.39132 type:complete len:232 (-) Transcript_13484:307-1002(-)
MVGIAHFLDVLGIGRFLDVFGIGLGGTQLELPIHPLNVLHYVAFAERSGFFRVQQLAANLQVATSSHCGGKCGQRRPGDHSKCLPIVHLVAGHAEHLIDVGVVYFVDDGVHEAAEGCKATPVVGRQHGEVVLREVPESGQLRDAHIHPVRGLFRLLTLRFAFSANGIRLQFVHELCGVEGRSAALECISGAPALLPQTPCHLTVQDLGYRIDKQGPIIGRPTEHVHDFFLG